MTFNPFPGSICSHSATVLGRNWGSIAIPRITASLTAALRLGCSSFGEGIFWRSRNNAGMGTCAVNSAYKVAANP